MLIWLSALGVLRVRRDCDFGRYATSRRDSVLDDDPNDSMTTRMLPSRYWDFFRKCARQPSQDSFTSAFTSQIRLIFNYLGINLLDTSSPLYLTLIAETSST